MCIFGGFCGVAILVISESRDRPYNPNDKHGFNQVSIIIACIVPFLLSLGLLAQRYIRELNFYTAGAYIAGSSIPIYSIQMVRRELSFTHTGMNVIDYVIVAIIAGFGAMQLIF